jgi:hypothetical protein
MTEDHARLACGRDPGALVDQVADGSPFPVDDHQRGCPHCQAALAEFGRLWGPVLAVADHQPRAPEGVVDEALRSIRGVSADPEYGRIEGTEGRTRISARVVVRLARHLAGRVPGVRVALSGLVAAGAGPETRLDPTLVEITLAADYGQDLVALAARIRAVVAEGIRRQTGLEPVAVLVHIDDIFV